MAGVAAAVIAPVLAACGAPTESVSPDDLPSAVTRFAAAQHQDGQRYAVPPRAAREALSEAVVALGDGDRGGAESRAQPHGYRVVDGPDGTVLLQPRRVPDERGWGLVAVRPGGEELVVEVPHPRSDRDTDDLGARLAVAARARYLVVAGAHRDLAGGAADPSAREDSLLHAVHVALAQRGVPAVQVHGYADDSLPSADAVVSPGSAEPGALWRVVVDAVSGLDLRVCPAEGQDCGQLEGRTNVQGRASAGAGVGFVHIELARRVRQEAIDRDRLARAVGEAVRALPG